MYMYDETTGKKGSKERVSLLKHYIDYYLSEEIKILYLFSTSCAGQKSFWWTSFETELLLMARSLKYTTISRNVAIHLCPVISHFCRLNRLNTERIMFMCQKIDVTF